MAIQRTVTQKIESESQERIHLTYVLPKPALQVRKVEAFTTDQTKVDTNAVDTKLFGYSASLIYGDIVKTLIVTTVTIGILVSLVLSGRV